jgi:prepilin-type N-terminal cleavage/methylation domain-containing protein
MTPAPATTRARGFTLIELLVSIALMSMLLTALLGFVFSMTEIWGHGSESRLFNQHVDAVTRHLESMLRRASLPTGGDFPREPFSVREISTTGHGTVTGLAFTLTDGDRLLTWSGAPAPFAQCVLSLVPREGLVLFWRSQLEADPATWREGATFPFINSLTYSYLDQASGSWRTEASLQHAADGTWLVPDMITLYFTHGKSTADRSLALPLALNGTPAF